MELQLGPEELARIGDEILHRKVEPKLGPGARGLFVAIDVADEDFEIDADDHAAVTRLLARKPSAEIWLARVGWSAACRIGSLG